MSNDERAIRDLVATWLSASKSGDLDTVLDLMTDDVVFLVPGAQFGKAEFATAATAMKDMRIVGESEIDEVRVLGDWAFLRSRMRLTTTRPGGAAIQRAGAILSIVQKGADGKWRIARDANFVMPAGA